MGLLEEQDFTADNAKQYIDRVSSYEAPNMVLTHTNVFMEFQKVILGLAMAVRKALNRLEPQRFKFVTAQELFKTTGPTSTSSIAPSSATSLATSSRSRNSSSTMLLSRSAS